MHGRTHRPAGLPKGVAGTYDRNPGTNGDDIAPPMPVHDDPDILRRELASIPQRDGPEYDGLRTRLARAELGQMESKEKHATAADMFRSLSETCRRDMESAKRRHSRCRVLPFTIPRTEQGRGNALHHR